MNIWWQQKKLGDVCDIVNGGTPKTGVREYWGGKNLWITPAEMGKRRSPYVDDTERKITELGLRDSSARLLPPESVILSSRAPIGHLVINTEPMATNQGCKGLVPGSQLQHKFLYYYLSGNVDLLNSLGTGTTFKELSGGKLKEITIPIPPLAEQQRVVGILDEAFDGVATAKANAEKNLQNARAIFESYLQSVFTQRGKGWVENTLGKVCTFSSGGTPSKSNPKYWSGSIPWVSGRDMKKDRIGYTALHISQVAVSESAARIAPIGTLLILVRGMGLANGIAIAELIAPCAFNQDIKAIHSKSDIVPRFLLFSLKVSLSHSDGILNNAAHGTLKIDMDDLRDVPVSIPSRDVQREIVSRIDFLSEETQRLQFVYERKLAALEALKKSLLHQAFSGDLTRESVASGVVVFPKTIPNIAPIDMHAGILAIAYQKHEEHSRQGTFGHVKAEKIAHMVEAHVGIDLGRSPVKDAAGPNDYRHLKQVEHRAEKAAYFSFKQTNSRRYTFRKLRRFDELTQKARNALGADSRAADELIDLMAPMETQQAEIFATVFAAWNNLLIDGQDTSDEAIVSEARENWHRKKLEIPREKFFNAIEWMKKKNIVPVGRGKRVVNRETA